MVSVEIRPTTSLATRFRQGVRSLATFEQHVPFPERFSTSVSPAVVQQWETLPSYDRRHMRAVAAELSQRGCNQFTVLAGLLHDIGKPNRTSTLVRAVHVILKRFGPPMESLVRSCKFAVPGLRTLRELITHAEAGADYLAAHDLHDRIVWLVRHHHDDLPDTDLLLLQATDDRH